MTRLIEIVNAVRSRCSVEWLTPSQRAVYETLTKGFSSQPLLNVYGDHGVGKTVLAWVLERQGYGVYRVQGSDLPTGTARVLLDNFQMDRRGARRLIDHMRDANVAQCVLITAGRIDDDLPAFEVGLTGEDCAKCRVNLYQQLDVRFYSDREFGSLHDLVISGVKGVH